MPRMLCHPSVSSGQPPACSRRALRPRHIGRVAQAAIWVMALLIVGSGARSAAAVDKLAQAYQRDVLPFLKTHCLSCHGEQRQEAKLDLSRYTSSRSVAQAHQTWAEVLQRIASGEMPPEDAADQPTPQQRETVIKWIKAFREDEARRTAGDPGPVLPRRLSNAEYNHSIRDLTGVDLRPTKTFPVDPANQAGFDNSGESLSMSPALLNKYLAAAREVAEHLVLTPEGIAFAAHPAVTDTDRDKYCVKRIIQFYQQQPTDFADYFLAAWQLQQSHGGRVTMSDITARAASHKISPRYLKHIWHTLTEQSYTLGPLARLQRQWKQLPQSLAEETQARTQCEQMRDDVMRIRGWLVPRFPDLTVPGSHKGSQPFVLWKNRQYAKHRRQFVPETLATAISQSASEPEDQRLTLPATEDDQRALQAECATFCSIFPDAFFVSERGRDYLGKPKAEQEKGRLLSAGFHSMMGYFRDDRPLYELILSDAQRQELDRLWLELDVIAAAPLRQYSGFLWFERTDSRYLRDPEFDFARAEDKHALSESMIKQLSELYLAKARKNDGSAVALQAIQDFFQNINAQIRRVEQVRKKAEPRQLAAVLEFAARAYRRPLSAVEQAELRDYYQELRSEAGLEHEAALQDTLVLVLMSPMFCYRLDLGSSPQGPRPLTDQELASRLSYFLWASTPDHRLTVLASQGRLRAPDVLAAETQRMLADPRVRGLATEFGANWLGIRRFEEHNSVDRVRFPVFTDELRQAMFEEPLRLIMDVASRNQSIMSFLTARHTFVNRQLAQHYGIPSEQIDGLDWQRVDDVNRYHRGGLLTMSVFLTQNAPGLRTSPVKRGYWVVRRLLGERIPPPPPDVPELPADEADLGQLTLRQALAKHRDHKSCAGCHQRFDSIGLVFENYGPVGELRDRDLGGRPVSTQALLPGNVPSQGVGDLQTYLTQRRRSEYVDNFCRKLLSYALGRSLLLSDEPLLLAMQASTARNGHRLGDLVLKIVNSPQFLNKRGTSGTRPGSAP